MALHLSKTGRNAPRRTSLRKSTSHSPYQVVTDRIVEALEAGIVPWRKPWQDSTSLPCNAISHRQYHGINLLLLGLARYRDHRWLTYRQAEEQGGHVRAGEPSSIAVFWKQWEPAKDEDCEENGKRGGIPLLRYYHLFNAEQCVGLKLPELEVTTRPQNQRIEAAESLFRSLPDPPRLHEGCKSACYYPLVDIVQMPPIDIFETPDAYYATLFHELGHATGHVSRLNRPGVNGRPGFGTVDYSREELIAELISAFCCVSIGLDNSLIDNSASYIQGWLTALRSDTRAIVNASAHAQRAADYLQRGIRNEEAVDSAEETT